MANYANDIKELIDRLHETISSDEKWYGIGPMDQEEYGSIDIAKTLDNTIENTIEYWNESVQQVLENFREELSKYDDKTIQDAGYSFLNEPYVEQWKDGFDRTYLDARTDEIKSVLENNNDLDFTQLSSVEPGMEGEIISNLLTRLLMPQYSRRVEIEDLNRNFWVISQNLSMLNKLIIDAPWKDAIEGIVSEITGLWDNVYRIWQAILYLAYKVDNFEDDIYELGNQVAKTKVKLSYGQTWTDNVSLGHEDIAPRLYLDYESDNFGENGVVRLTDTFIFKPGDSRYFGILPFLERETINYTNKNDEITQGYVYYLPYNKTILTSQLDLMTDEEVDERFVLDYKNKGPEKTGEIICIEREFGDKPAREILEEVRSKNFVLVSPALKGEHPVLDELMIVASPVEAFLQFYRDYLYYTISINNFTVEELYKQNKIDDYTDAMLSTQLHYLQYLVFDRSKEKKYNMAETLPESVVAGYRYLFNKLGVDLTITSPLVLYLNSQFGGSNDLSEITVEQIYNEATLNGTLSVEEGLIKELKGFYLLYALCADKLANCELNRTYSVLTVDGEEERSYFPYFEVNGLNSINIVDNDIRGLMYFLTGILSPGDKEESVEGQSMANYYRDNSSDGAGTVAFIPTWCLMVDKEIFMTTIDKDGNETLSLEKINIVKKDGTTVACSFTTGATRREWIEKYNAPFLSWDLVSYEIPNELFRGFSEVEKAECINYDKTKNKNHLGQEMDFLESLRYNYQIALFAGGWYNKEDMGVFGNSYLSNATKTFGIWYDFVQTPHSRANSQGEIKSLTVNYLNYIDTMRTTTHIFNQGLWYQLTHIYNTDLSVQIRGVSNVQYENFLRYGKPYPSIASILHDKENNIPYYERLNDKENYIHYTKSGLGSYPQGDLGYFIDGFLGFESTKNYPSDKKNASIPCSTYNGKINIEEGTYEAETVHRRTRGEDVDYYGPCYEFWTNNAGHHLCLKQYTLASTDLVNAQTTTALDVNGVLIDPPNNDFPAAQGRTMWENFNESENPAISISYLSSDGKEQLLSVFIAKDTTGDEWIYQEEKETEDIVVTNTEIKMLRIGDFYPTDTQKLVVANTTDYPIDTYGYNAHNYSSKTTGTNLSFVPYRTYEKDIEQIEFISKNDLTDAKLTEIGTQAIQSWVDTKKLDKPTMIVTRIGVNFWRGGKNQSSARWQLGEICDLFYVDPAQDKIIKIYTFNKEDGYWDGSPDDIDNNGYDAYEVKSGSRYRHLMLISDIIKVKKINDEVSEISGRGYINLYDKNVMGDYDVTKNDSCRVRGSFTQKENNEGTRNEERVVAYCNFSFDYQDDNVDFKYANKDNTFEEVSVCTGSAGNYTYTNNGKFRNRRNLKNSVYNKPTDTTTQELIRINYDVFFPDFTVSYPNLKSHGNGSDGITYSFT